ncbi:MAG: hypothetical protein QOK51_00060 [Nitrososphaeraceae archaeon]|nr:hypothetical protein [Nitrososphaeraceae archaeon]MDW0321940.1 hypothetical protein [Nitrososphaeraceae archaeon]MDW0329206.1 hypothetical protein [Nitrososphaeraceae archaeon]MDW3620500.1 hypothetical protein [Nitrososphaeraceae archaeon]
MRVPNSKPLLVSAILAILFSFNLSIPQLMQNSEGLPFTYVSESAAKSNPFYKSAAGQVIYDYFPTTEKKDPNSNTNEVINQLIDSLIQEKVAKPEICEDNQDNDGNGKIDENCNVGDASQDNAVIKASDEKKSFDKFGVLKIFQTKKDGQQWYLKSNPNSDPQFSPQTTLTKNSDGSFKIKSMKVRMGVFTSSGFNPEKIDTLDHSKIAMAEYMQSPNDWRDVEITGYVKLNSGNNDNFVWYARGARHTGFGAPAGCEGTAYKGDLFYDGSTRWTKEQWHTGGYAFGEFGKNIGPISGKWVGLKVIMYNAVEKDKSVVKLELWVDKNNNNNWIKANEKTDKGGWGNAGRECGGKADQIITWGGPIAAFRWDGATDVDIKKFSVREIVPHI